jgi:hypothetical protein
MVIFLLRLASAPQSDAAGASADDSGCTFRDVGLLALSSVQSRGLIWFK